jgi:HlyD family secretion protein
MLGASLFLAGAGCERAQPGDDGAIVVSGNIEVIDARLSFKIPGRIVERPVDEGDSLEAGRLVARLDTAELEEQVALRRAELSMVAAALAELEAGSRPQEIAAAAAALRSAEAERDRARLELRRQEELRATDAVSERELETNRAQARVAEARVAELEERLALVREGPRKEAIAQARSRADVARAALALAETQLANGTLVAPMAGVVLEKHAEPGEFVAAGAPVVSMADTSKVWLRAYVNESDLGKVHLGQSVDVRTDTFPGRSYTGTLAFISPEAEFTPKTVQTHKERVTLVYRIRIDLDNASGELKPGMAADATLAVPAGETR